MTEAEWLRSDDWREMLAFLGDRATPRKTKLALCAGLRQIWDRWLYADVSRRAVEVVERMVDGQATQDEVTRADYDAEVPTWGYDFNSAAHLKSQGLTCHGPDIRRLIEWGVFSEADRYIDDIGYRGRIGDPEVVEQLLNSARIARDIFGDREHVIQQVTQQTDWSGGCLLRDIFGNPFRPVVADPHWLTEAAVGIAWGVYDDRAFERMPILADALEDAGCEDAELLSHCREPGTHVRGCWVVDLVLSKS